MADIKDIQIDDILIDKYGNEFKVHSFFRVDYDLEDKIIVKIIKRGENSPVIYIPALRFGSQEYALKEFNEAVEYNSFGMLALLRSSKYILELIGNPEDNLKYVPCYSEMYIKGKQGALDGIENCALKGDELQEDINPESLDVVLLDMFKQAGFDDETRSRFIKRLKLIWDDGEPRTSVGFADELVDVLRRV